MLVPACCRIWFFENSTISLAMSTSRIRLSDAVRFSWYVARLFRVCSRRFCTAPNEPRSVETASIAASMPAMDVDVVMSMSPTVPPILLPRDAVVTAIVSLSGAIGTSGTGGLSEITALSTTAGAKTALDTGALSDISVIDNAIKNISTARANLGAVQNRLEHRLNNLATYQENLTASESRIRDVDMASEMTSYTKENILQQAGTSMLAQANQAPQNVLSLLR